MRLLPATELTGIEKPIPHSKDAEQNVLGALMLDNRVYDDVADIVNAADFLHAAHRSIFIAIGTLAQANQPFDPVTLSEWLGGRKELDAVGGLSYLGAMAKNTATVFNASAYALIVRNYSVQRRLLQTANDIQASVYGAGSTQEKIDHAQAALMSVLDNAANKCEIENTNQILIRVIDKIDAAYHNKGQIQGLASGFVDLDKKTDGLHVGELVIIAGRPSMGKTTLAMNIARHIATQGNPVMVFSLEMPADGLLMREVAAIGGIDHARLRAGQLDDDEWPRVTHATGVLGESKIIIDSSPSLGLVEVKARARREMRKQPLKLIVIDYLQLMKNEDSKNKNRNEEISALTRGLKQLARELNIPVIVLSQLNRELERRPNKRPIMADLRDSGGIEQDADVILFVYRDEVYNEDTERKGIAEIIVSKQRNGPTGMIPLTFQGEYCRFMNYAGEPPVVHRAGLPKKSRGLPPHQDHYTDRIAP